MSSQRVISYALNAEQRARLTRCIQARDNATATVHRRQHARLSESMRAALEEFSRLPGLPTQAEIDHAHAAVQEGSAGAALDELAARTQAVVTAARISAFSETESSSGAPTEQLSLQIRRSLAGLPSGTPTSAHITERVTEIWQAPPPLRALLLADLGEAIAAERSRQEQYEIDVANLDMATAVAAELDDGDLNQACQDGWGALANGQPYDTAAIVGQADRALARLEQQETDEVALALYTQLWQAQGFIVIPDELEPTHAFIARSPKAPVGMRVVVVDGTAMLRQVALRAPTDSSVTASADQQARKDLCSVADRVEQDATRAGAKTITHQVVEPDANPLPVITVMETPYVAPVAPKAKEVR